MEQDGSGQDLNGRVALVTGGGRARGQGAAEGRMFAARGATVVLADVIDEEGERTAGEIQACSVVPYL
jgi:3alpha(or 20beta)-hydroxysteroid dehydrogenase